MLLGLGPFYLTELFCEYEAGVGLLTFWLEAWHAIADSDVIFTEQACPPE